jgi:hypothetical protein
MVTRFDVGERTNLHFPVRNLLSKTYFLDLDEKEVENVNERESTNMLNFNQEMSLMNEESFVVLI